MCITRNDYLVLKSQISHARQISDIYILDRMIFSLKEVYTIYCVLCSVFSSGYIFYEGVLLRFLNVAFYVGVRQRSRKLIFIQ